MSQSANRSMVALVLIAGLLPGGARSAQPETATNEAETVGGGNEHPLSQWVEIGLARISQVETYTCELFCQERIDGELNRPKTIFAKVRHEKARQPNSADGTDSRISLYLHFNSPDSVKGRELLFCNAAIDDPKQWRIVVRKGGKSLAFLTAELSPTCAMAMQDCRYPITEFGLKRLIERMSEVAKQECMYAECDVQIDPDVGFAGQSCTKIEVRHPERHDHFKFHLACIYIANDLKLPIHFSAYDWPAESGAKPELIESYTYQSLQLNVALSDDDFDRSNPAYGFK